MIEAITAYGRTFNVEIRGNSGVVSLCLSGTDYLPSKSNNATYKSETMHHQSSEYLLYQGGLQNKQYE